MADFNESFDMTMDYEGYYVNDSDDVGGETYRGIARNFHPTWYGWNLIDDMKPNIDHDKLDPSVRSFYETNYWDRLQLDEVKDQDIADELFDTAVNMGVGRAGRFLQECLNYLNRNESLFKDLVEDGVVGPATLTAFNMIDDNDIGILLTMLNVCQGRHYMEYMKKSPIQEKYARGWFSRVCLEKEYGD